VGRQGVYDKKGEGMNLTKLWTIQGSKLTKMKGKDHEVDHLNLGEFDSEI